MGRATRPAPITSKTLNEITTMKKIKLLLGLAVLAVFAMTASAQNGRIQRVLGDGIVSMTVSNTLQFTNLNSPGVVHSNVVGMTFTNLSSAGASQRATVTAGGSGYGAQGQRTNYTQTLLTKDVNLWPNLPPITANYATSTNPVGTLQPNQPSYGNITIKGQGGSGANGTITFYWVPLPDGTNESTIAADLFVHTITGTTTTPICVFTNFPLHRWQGVQKARLKVVTSGVTTASSDFTLTDINVAGPY